MEGDALVIGTWSLVIWFFRQLLAPRPDNGLSTGPETRREGAPGGWSRQIPQVCIEGAWHGSADYRFRRRWRRQPPAGRSDRPGVAQQGVPWMGRAGREVGRGRSGRPKDDRRDPPVPAGP